VSETVTEKAFSTLQYQVQVLTTRVQALEHSAATPVEGELIEADPADPVQAGFDAYRARAREVEDRHERRQEGKQ